MFFTLRELLQLTLDALAEGWAAMDWRRRLAAWWWVIRNRALLDAPPPEWGRCVLCGRILQGVAPAKGALWCDDCIARVVATRADRTPGVFVRVVARDNAEGASDAA